MVVAPASAQQAAAPVDVAVPAGPLDAALRNFSSQAGVQLVYTSDLVAGKATEGIKGQFSIEQAIAQLLRGTGLTFRVMNGRIVQIELPEPGEAGEHVLGPVRVEGAQGDSSYVPATRGDGIAQLGGIRGRQDQEADGYRARVANIGTGAQIAIEDIPRSISVLGPEQIAKQDIMTIGDALQRLPGVTIIEKANLGANYDSIEVRGFEVQEFQIDGGPMRNLAAPGNNLALNLDAYERVELVRGPNALFGGADSPGGSINLVRKRPGAAPAASFTVDVGSYRRVNAVADISTPSLFGSPIAFRGVASARREGSFVKDYSTKNVELYGIFDAPLGDSARLELGGEYQRLRSHGEYNGTIRAIDGSLIPQLGRDFNYAAGTGAYSKSDSKEIFTKLNADLTKDWAFEFSGFYQSTSSQYDTINSSLNVFRADGTSYKAGELSDSNYGPSTSTQIGISSKITGRFNTFGLTHNIFAGIEYNRTDTTGAEHVTSTVTASVSTIAALLNPVYTSNFSDSTPGYSGSYSANTGLVIGDTISWHDIVSIGAIARRDTADVVSVAETRDNGTPTDISTSSPVVSGGWRPSYSATIKPFRRLTVYGSYADGFKRQDSDFSRSGTASNYTYKALAPSTYKNKEIGIKYGGSRFLVTLSVFDLKQVNVATAISGLQECPDQTLGAALDGQCFAVQGTNSTSRGVDSEFTGQILKNLSVIASYNYNKTKDTSSGVPLQTLAPQSSASVFIDWSPTFLAGFSIQLGAKYKSRYYNTGDISLFDASGNEVGSQAFVVSQAAYAVADVGLDYQVNKHLGLRIFVENLFDKTYFSTLQVGQGNFYGRPRSFMVSLKYSELGAIPANGASPTTGLAPFGDPADWYAAFDVGYNIAGDLKAKASGKAQDGTTTVAWKFQTKNAPAFAARLGYHLSDNLRSELEVKYRSSKFGTIGGAAVAPFGVCGAEGSAQGVPFDCKKVPGKTDNWSLMANLIYDFGARDALFQPFVGGGFGVSRNSVNFQGKLDGIGSSSPFNVTTDDLSTSDRELQEKIVSADTTTSVVWQAIAGISIKVSNRLRLDGMGRFIQVPGMKFSTYNLDQTGDNGYAVPQTPRIGTFKADYNSVMLSIGVRWAFGEK